MKSQRFNKICCLTVVALTGLTAATAAAQQNAPESKTEAAVHQLLQASQDGTGYVVVLLKPSVPGGFNPQTTPAAVQQTQQQVLGRLAPGEFTPVYRFGSIFAMTGRVNAAGLARMELDPDVERIGVDLQGHAQMDSSAGFIQANHVWQLGYTGAGVTVAVLDSGIDTDHPDLVNSIALGAYHFLNNGVEQGPGAEDDNGHGTHVAGTITSDGLVAPRGIAPDTSVLPIKVLDADGDGWALDWAAGVDYVTLVRQNYPSLCAINMSLGTSALYAACPCDNSHAAVTAMHTAIQAARNAGILTFVSSGNDGSCTSMGAPACVSSAVAVAAVYDGDYGRQPPGNGTYRTFLNAPSFADCFDAASAPSIVTCFSNRSGCNRLAAPGHQITAPWIGGGTLTSYGTSMAAPHCTAVAALLRQAANQAPLELAPDDIMLILDFTSTASIDPCNNANPNPKVINALAAIQQIAGPIESSEWMTMDCGGVTADNAGIYTLGGTIGQPDAVELLTDGVREIRGGFWLYQAPPAPACCVGDMNADGLRNGRDIQMFVQAIVTPPAPATPEFCRANINLDAAVNFADVARFVQMLIQGAGCS